MRPLPGRGSAPAAPQFCRDAAQAGAWIPGCCTGGNLDPGASPPAPLSSACSSSPTWLRRAGLGAVPGLVPARLRRAGLAVRGLARLGAVPAGLGSDQEGGAAQGAGGAGRGRTADVWPDPVGFGLCRRDLRLIHGEARLGSRGRDPLLYYMGAQSREGSFVSANTHQSGNRAEITASSEQESSHVWQMSTALGSSVSAGPGRPP